jgi:hypothetical protein
VGEWDVAVIHENFTIQVIAGRVPYRLQVVRKVNVTGSNMDNTVREASGVGGVVFTHLLSRA